MAYIYYVELRISRGFLRNKAVFNIGSTDFALLFLTYEHVFRQSYTIPEYNWLNFSIFRQKKIIFWNLYFEKRPRNGCGRTPCGLMQRSYSLRNGHVFVDCIRIFTNEQTWPMFAPIECPFSRNWAPILAAVGEKRSRNASTKSSPRFRTWPRQWPHSHWTICAPI